MLQIKGLSLAIPEQNRGVIGFPVFLDRSADNDREIREITEVRGKLPDRVAAGSEKLLSRHPVFRRITAD